MYYPLGKFHEMHSGFCIEVLKYAHRKTQDTYSADKCPALATTLA